MEVKRSVITPVIKTVFRNGLEVFAIYF